jgi:glycosyltransferase involved in cell wall biosynthesis
MNSVGLPPSKDESAQVRLTQEEKFDPPALVSVAIACYNGATYLAEAIESVLAQTYEPVELILVDDGSTDHSADIAARYSTIRTMYQTNQGVAQARNRGLQACKGEYVLFLDQDDRLLPNAIAIGIRQLQAHPECGFVFGHALIIHGDGSPNEAATQATASSYLPNYDYPTLLQGRGNICPPSTVLFRRTIVYQVGGFDSSFGMADDYDIYLKIARSFPIYCHHEPVTEYRQYEENYPARKLIQLREDVRAIFQAQYLYVQANPVYEKAYRQGKLHWDVFWARALRYYLFKHIKQRNWSEARKLWAGLIKFPALPFLSSTERF